MSRRSGSKILLPVFIPLSLIYSFLVWIRGIFWQKHFFKAHILNAPTISVGNIEAGGTGKSPVVLSLGKFLKNQGYFPGILTRGYGVAFQKSDYMILLNGKCLDTSNRQLRIPDEARMQSISLDGVPVVIGPDRYGAYLRYLSFLSQKGNDLNLAKVTHWILEDGFQHFRLQRQLDIVLLSQSCFGEKPLPWGMLREPLSALKRAQVLFFMGALKSHMTQNMSELLRQQKISAKTEGYVVKLEAMPISKSVDWRPYHLGSPKGSQVQFEPITFEPQQHLPAFLICGIANPEVFNNDFIRLYSNFFPSSKSPVKGTYFVKDHGRFDRIDLLDKIKKSGSLSVITTAKDLAREPELFAEIEQVAVLKVFVLELAFVHEENFWANFEPLKRITDRK